MEPKITVKDIAKKAGVSTGTVDRVLHNRGNVSVRAKAKVLRAIKDLKYKKNILASTLAYNKTFRVATLLPNPQQDPFWEQPELGLNKAEQATMHYGLKIKRYYFNDGDVESFIEQSREVLQIKPDAILFAAAFFHEANHFLESCKKKGIPTVLINTDTHHKDVLCYVGQDSYQSGVLAGKLIHSTCHGGNTVVFLHLGSKSTNAQHILDKEKGFRDYFDQNGGGNIKVSSYGFEDFDKKKKLRTLIEKKFPKPSDIRGVFIANSRAYKIIESLEGTVWEGLKIVGFDLIEPNLKYLNEEKIEFLINQRPMLQAYHAILNIADHLILKKTIEREQYLPLDIVVKENVAYYLEREVKFHIGA